MKLSNLLQLINGAPNQGDEGSLMNMSLPLDCAFQQSVCKNYIIGIYFKFTILFHNFILSDARLELRISLKGRFRSVGAG